MTEKQQVIIEYQLHMKFNAPIDDIAKLIDSLITNHPIEKKCISCFKKIANIIRDDELKNIKDLERLVNNVEKYFNDLELGAKESIEKGNFRSWFINKVAEVNHMNTIAMVSEMFKDSQNDKANLGCQD